MRYVDVFRVIQFEAVRHVLVPGKPQSVLSLGLCEWLSARYLQIQISAPGVAALARRTRQIRPSVATAEENL